jgi:hypothetical protein
MDYMGPLPPEGGTTNAFSSLRDWNGIIASKYDGTRLKLPVVGKTAKP